MKTKGKNRKVEKKSNFEKKKREKLKKKKKNTVNYCCNPKYF
jgi:hypothetical protein